MAEEAAPLAIQAPAEPAAADPNVNNNATMRSGKNTAPVKAKKVVAAKKASSVKAKKSPAKKKAASAAAAGKLKYIDMVAAAIAALKSRTGSSRQAIAKYIAATYKADSVSALRLALKSGAAKGTLVVTKGVGAAGSYKLAPKPAAPKKVAKKPATPKKAAKKPAVKKVAAKKSPAKKTAAKKTAVKKSPAKKKPAAKKAKSPAKKKAPVKKAAVKKSPAKKPAAKKAAPKKK